TAVAVQELDRTLLEERAGPLLTRLERAFDRLPAPDVAQLDSDLGRAATHLDVVVVEDLPELAIELDGHAFLEVSGGDHADTLLGAGGGSDDGGFRCLRWTRATRPAGCRERVSGRECTGAARSAAHDRDLARGCREARTAGTRWVEHDQVLDPDTGLAIE